MNTAIIMLGSNADANENIELAKEKLEEFFEITAQSDLLISQASGKYKNDFINQAIKILSDEHAEETKTVFKQIEIEMGRTAESKASGIVPIDIDLIFWNDVQVHDDYNNLEFVKKCVDEIIN